MIIVNIIGGLGNQMFQYAFAYAYLMKKESVVGLDIGSFKVYDLREYEPMELKTTNEKHEY